MIRSPTALSSIKSEFHPQVVSHGFLGIVLFCLGYPDQALAPSNAAIAEARRLAHPPSVAVSLTLGARLRLLVGDNTVLGEWADQLVAVATEQGFALAARDGNDLSRVVQGQKW